MHSDDCIKIDYSQYNLWGFANTLLDNIVDKFNLTGILISKQISAVDHELLLSSEIPTEPFTGSEKNILSAIITQCNKHHKKPHIHSLDTATVKKLTSFSKKLIFSGKVAYIPFIISNNIYIALCFVGKDEKIINNDLVDTISESIVLINTLNDSDILINRLKTLENYIKETGHDFSSSVQSTITKLRNITRGYYSGDFIIQKVAEAEKEIWSAYRYASNIGLVIEENYKASNCSTFNLSTSITAVINQQSSEADEKHIKISYTPPQFDILFYGDEDAISSAISHLLINAIKYAFGSSTIDIYLSIENGNITFRILNRGIQLREKERVKIWKCGIRGIDAYEKHVNGSGIGLYTVKKIISAHSGYVGASNKDNEYVEFCFVLPVNGKFGSTII